MEQGTGSLLSPPELTPLEQEVLDEYERLAENMNKVRVRNSSPRSNLPRVNQAMIARNTTNAHPSQLANVLEHLAANPSTEILDGLRELERKTSLAFTLLKASVYSIVLQQEIDWGDGSNA